MQTIMRSGIAVRSCILVAVGFLIVVQAGNGRTTKMETCSLIMADAADAREGSDEKKFAKEEVERFKADSDMGIQQSLQRWASVVLLVTVLGFVVMLLR